MNLAHLNSDQRQYFWMSVIIAVAFAYLVPRASGLSLLFCATLVVVEIICAISIYRGWRHAPWIYLFGCLVMSGWGLAGFLTEGFSMKNLCMFCGGIASASGFYWLRLAMSAGEEVDTEDEMKMDLFELPEEYEEQVKGLGQEYARLFGEVERVHHLVPLPLWLHRYAEFVVTIPPTETRSTWLYGTLLVSSLSGEAVELILERPERDTSGAIGTLARLIEYFADYAPLREWETMGRYPFFGEESSVRGLLFCRPPDGRAEVLELPTGKVRILYVAGISDDQLTTAQAADDELGDFAGAKALHAELRIAESGIANLPN